MKIKVLHLANDYSGSTVYKNLCEALDRQGVEQAIYVGVRLEKLVNKNAPVFSIPTSTVIYRNILNFYTRLDFLHKIQKVKNDVIKSIDVHQYKIVHAHTWYSDGAVAYELNKTFGIPYIVTIRGTDYNVFFKHMLHLRHYGLRILQGASKIIFISPSYQRKLHKSSFFLKRSTILDERSVVIPNGIHDYWLNNPEEKKQSLEIPLKLLYVGRFTKGKNTERLIKSVDELISRGIECRLSLVGGGGTEHQKIMKMIKSKSHIRYFGKVADKNQLKDIFRQNDIFVMPSRFETFGLVYIEAISQGIPVVFTARQAIDGLYDPAIGEAVRWNDVNDIAGGIEKIYRNYDKYAFNAYDIVKNHRWDDIAHKYDNIYTSVIQ